MTAYHRKINTGILAKGTMKNYGATEKYFKNFLTTQLHRDDIFLIELDYEFLTEFEHYVRNNPIKASDPCVGNGVIKHLQRLRGMVSWAKKLKWIEIDPLEDYTQNPKKPKRKKLDLYELMRIEQHQRAVRCRCRDGRPGETG
ncbi:phage integrase SAM-like domain-containing protein [Chitinophaga caeni]|uniref:phage integrase SAM-like domain-containing protein n=1 Tax=Chitinophaga caeni TaxID=2029983 RepID=UPI0012FE7320|nr:phage integrase SAM-like domain-containing protein [Chitinophaga caeni]